MTLYVFYILMSQLIFGILTQFFESAVVIKNLKMWYYGGRLRGGKFCGITQKELNEVYEAPDMSLFFRYSNSTKTFFVAVFFSYIVPMGPLICLVYLIMQYWMDKYLILRRYKAIIKLNSDLSIQMMEFTELSFIIYTSGNVFFHYTVKHSYKLIELLTLFFSLLILLLPIMELAKKSVTKPPIIRWLPSENEDPTDRRRQE